MSDSIHKLSEEELKVLAAKAKGAKSTAYCTLELFTFWTDFKSRLSIDPDFFRHKYLLM